MDFRDDFKDSTIVITGACGVFGRWIATAFAQRGARLCLSDNRAEALEALANELGTTGPGHIRHVTELTDEASIADLVSTVSAEWGAPDVVINNAGIYPSGFLLDIDAAEWDRIMDVNTRAPFLVAQGFAKAMIAKGKRGSIINISSGAARKMRRSVVPYCVSKTALDRLTKGLALELAEYGIRVNIVEPGFAPGSEVSDITPEHLEAVSGSIPLGRQSKPDDAPNAIMFLASPLAEYVTGTSLAVDGGNSIGGLAVYQAKKKAL